MSRIGRADYAIAFLGIKTIALLIILGAFDQVPWTFVVTSSIISMLVMLWGVEHFLLDERQE